MCFFVFFPSCFCFFDQFAAEVVMWQNLSPRWGSKLLLWLTKPIWIYHPALDIWVRSHLLPSICNIICSRINLNGKIAIIVIDKVIWCDYSVMCRLLLKCLQDSPFNNGLFLWNGSPFGLHLNTSTSAFYYKLSSSILQDTSIEYQPGDAFSIVCPNPAAEVDRLIQRLGLCDQSENPFLIQLMAETKKRRAVVPEYIPQPCTVRHVLMHCCDIRTTLKKVWWELLAKTVQQPPPMHFMGLLYLHSWSDFFVLNKYCTSHHKP